MSDPQVKVECVNIAACSNCGEDRVCVSIVSTAEDKVGYNAPLFGLDLCQQCLQSMDSQIENTGIAHMQRRLPETPDVDEEAET